MVSEAKISKNTKEELKKFGAVAATKMMPIIAIEENMRLHGQTSNLDARSETKSDDEVSIHSIVAPLVTLKHHRQPLSPLR